jgi:hypothetical protein
MPKPHLDGLNVEETALKKKTALCARNKSSVQWRLIGVGKRIERDSIEACLWLMSIHIHSTSTYQYVTICT